MHFDALNLKKMECSIVEAKYEGVTPRYEKRTDNTPEFIQNLELKHDIDSLKCNQCSKKFSHKHNVQWHMKSVHQGLLYSCEQCEYKTKQLVNLKIHMH